MNDESKFSSATAATCGAMILALLVCLPSVHGQDDDEVSQQVTEAVARTQAYEKAVQIVIAAASSDNPALRANATEAMQLMPKRAEPVVRNSLADTNPAVRFAGAVVAGMLKMNQLSDALYPLTEDPNHSVRAAALFSLKHMGKNVNISILAHYLNHRTDTGLRSNVAMILGLMGERSAVPLLKQAALVPMPRARASDAELVRIQIAEALVKLGVDAELSSIRAGAFRDTRTMGEVRVLSIRAMGDVDDQRMIPAIARFLDSEDEPVEVRLASAEALAKMEEYRNVEYVIQMTQSEANEELPGPVVTAVRSQAAYVLGFYDDSNSLQRLIEMMNDPNPQVRIFAATSVVRRVGGG